MKDTLTKYFHFGFLFYAFWIGIQYQEELEIKQSSAKNDYEQMDKKRKKLKNELQEVKKFENNLDESRRRVQEVVSKIESIQRQLPSTINDTEVESKLSEFSNSLRMLNPNTIARGETNNGFYFTKDYSFDSQGTFIQFLIFFEKLENLATEGRILNVKYLKMNYSDAGDPRSRFQILNLTTTVEAYRYNANYNPKDG